MFLDAMCGKSCFHILEKVINGRHVSYKINFTNIINVRRQKQLEGIIQEKFGLNGARVYRLLHTKKRLEEKPIAELAMLEIKAARQLLYLMFTAGFVQLQETPPPGSLIIAHMSIYGNNHYSRPAFRRSPGEGRGIKARFFSGQRTRKGPVDRCCLRVSNSNPVLPYRDT